MKLRNKTIDKSKNKCMACSKDLCLNDIITRERLLCHSCFNIFSNIDIDDLEYELYKNKVKVWLLKKYKLMI